MNNKKNIFRKESLDKMSSPEKLNDYIKVSNPSVWIILGAIAIMLISVIVWSITYELPEGIRPIQFLLGG
ncbi:MAG: hypothetical protein FWE05_04055 [Defluviitaleaceae bacterium]|nr:hypothetical protein [Defluviitaleaceae bacterium]